MSTFLKKSFIALITISIIGGIFYFFNGSVALRAIISRINPGSQLAWVNGAGLQYSVDNMGIQSLSYNGVTFIGPPDTGGYGDAIKYVGGIFQAPGGATSTPDSLAGGIQVYSGLSYCPDQNKVGAQCYQHVYRPNLTDSFTVTVELSTYDNRTLLTDIYITNNDATDTMLTFGMGYWFGFAMHTPDLAPYHYYGGFSTSPLAFIPGVSWGNLVFYTDDYTKNANMSTSNTYDTSGNGTPPTNVGYIWNFNSQEPIAPGETFHYPLYLRFGDTTDTAKGLAGLALDAYAVAHPYTLDWPDRNPIARWFIAEGVAHTSALNPRGYLWDQNLDVSDQAAFDSAVLGKADEIIARLNIANPRPQGVLIWDLEGEEFHQIFTYVGSPDKLHDLAPEMDAVADRLMQKFTDAGYKVGLTLRPSTFITGTVLPATCHAGGGNGSWNDIFMKIDDQYPRGGYECFSENTWTHANPRFPNHQTYPTTDAGFLQNLKNKVDYAYQRWGTTMFYVDSTVYGDGGNSINPQIWRDLTDYLRTSDTTTHNGVPATSAKFIFFPENDSRDYVAVTAPYDQTDLGGYETPASATDIWPNAFSIYAHTSDVYNNLANASYSSQDARFDALQPTHDRLVRSIRAGNIFFAEGGWFQNDETIYQLYRDAADHANPSVTSFSIPSTSSSLTVPIDSFVATDTIGVMAYLVNESSATPSLDDAGWTVSVPTSYTFSTAGSKTLYAWARDAGLNISSASSGSVSVNLPVVSSGGSSGSSGSSGGGGGGSTSFYNPTPISSGSARPTTTPLTITPPLTGTIPSAYLNLPFGSRSTAVLTLQKYLITGGYLQAQYATGYYGQLTASAVAQYRLKQGGGTTPSVTPSTLTSYLFLGTTGAQVKTLQQILNAKGYTVTASGNESTYFGPATETALKRFQCATLSVCSGTPLTTGYGATGPRTRAALGGTSVSTTSSAPVVKATVATPTTKSIATPVKVTAPTKPAAVKPVVIPEIVF